MCINNINVEVFTLGVHESKSCVVGRIESSVGRPFSFFLLGNRAAHLRLS